MNDSLGKFKRGSVFAEEAYALGKVLDHSSWQHPREGDPRLPRRITPSDVDMTGDLFPIQAVFDNCGRQLFCEFSRTHDDWRALGYGQRLMYEGLIRNSANCAVLCRHSVRPEVGLKINTRYDVESFQPIIFDFETIRLPVICGNDGWQNFVLAWFKDPMKVRRQIITEYLRPELGGPA